MSTYLGALKIITEKEKELESMCPTEWGNELSYTNQILKHVIRMVHLMQLNRMIAYDDDELLLEQVGCYIGNNSFVSKKGTPIKGVRPNPEEAARAANELLDLWGITDYRVTSDDFPSVKDWEEAEERYYAVRGADKTATTAAVLE